MSDALVAELAVAPDEVRLRPSEREVRRWTWPAEMHLLLVVAFPLEAEQGDGTGPPLVSVPVLEVAFAGEPVVVVIPAEPGLKDGIDGDFGTARSNWQASGRYGTKSLSSS